MKAAEQILKQYKIAVTGQRLTVLNVFLNSSEPLNHSLLEKKIGNTISRYTIYRTLKLLSKKSVLHILPSQDGIAWYTLHMHLPNASEKTCIHFICRRCGKVDFVSGVSIPDLKKVGNHLVETIEVILKGCCTHCMQRG